LSQHHLQYQLYLILSLVTASGASLELVTAPSANFDVVIEPSGILFPPVAAVGDIFELSEMLGVILDLPWKEDEDDISGIGNKLFALSSVEEEDICPFAAINTG
jgi:hypothetical protein